MPQAVGSERDSSLMEGCFGSSGFMERLQSLSGYERTMKLNDSGKRIVRGTSYGEGSLPSALEIPANRWAGGLFSQEALQARPLRGAGLHGPEPGETRRTRGEQALMGSSIAP